MSIFIAFLTTSTVEVMAGCFWSLYQTNHFLVGSHLHQKLYKEQPASLSETSQLVSYREGSQVSGKGLACCLHDN